MKDNEPDPRPDAKATSNFLASSGKEFNGAQLTAFTAQRMAVASEMGMRWPYVEEDDQISLEFDAPAAPKGKSGKATTQKVKLLHYRQSYKDSIIALWLCSQPESRVDRAERKPKEAMDDAYAWAKSIGLFQGTSLCGLALVTWLQICGEVRESQSKPVSKEGKGPKGPEEDSGEL